MKKSHQTIFLLFVLLVCALCAIVPTFTFNDTDIVLFGLTLNELQAYIYFGSSGIISFLVIQYGYNLYTSKSKDGKDYEQYSNMVLDDNHPEPIEKI